MAAALDHEQEAHQQAVEAKGYVQGLTMLACAASDHQMDITGFQMMMLLAPLEASLERIEKELESG